MPLRPDIGEGSNPPKPEFSNEVSRLVGLWIVSDTEWGEFLKKPVGYLKKKKNDYPLSDTDEFHCLVRSAVHVKKEFSDKDKNKQMVELLVDAQGCLVQRKNIEPALDSILIVENWLNELRKRGQL